MNDTHDVGLSAPPKVARDTATPIERIVEMATETSFGRKSFSDQQITETLGELVKSRLLTAEDSYRLRDQLTDLDRFDQFLGERLTAILQRRCLI